MSIIVMTRMTTLAGHPDILPCIKGKNTINASNYVNMLYVFQGFEYIDSGNPDVFWVIPASQRLIDLFHQSVLKSVLKSRCVPSFHLYFLKFHEL